MVSGLVLTRLSAGEEKSVMAAIRQIPGVVDVVPVFGRWDLIIRVKAETLEEMTSTIVSRIRAIPSAVTTETLVITSIKSREVLD